MQAERSPECSFKSISCVFYRLVSLLLLCPQLLHLVSEALPELVSLLRQRADAGLHLLHHLGVTECVHAAFRQQTLSLTAHALQLLSQLLHLWRSNSINSLYFLSTHHLLRMTLIQWMKRWLYTHFHFKTPYFSRLKSLDFKTISDINGS